MIQRLFSLRIFGSLLILTSFTLGGISVWLWAQSNFNWQSHQAAAQAAGYEVYHALQNGTAPSKGVTIAGLSPKDQARALAGEYRQISFAPHAARITNVPISADVTKSGPGAPLSLAILSPHLIYRLADLPVGQGQTAANTMGAVSRMLASYCSDPVVLAKMGDAPWVALDGAGVWHCAAAPADRRLIGVILAVIALGGCITAILNLSSDFRLFADQLRNRRRIGGPARYHIPGPAELQEIVGSVNNFLEIERDQLASRAAVLSGVSHDLGTPATRLRLRAALISDAELRTKLEADIDSMTGIIESVMTYTRVEMNVEKPRKLSLTSLIESVVADYIDMGRRVSFRHQKDRIVQGGRSVFMLREGQSVVTADRDVTIFARPISLERALTNLIENALKYGRRAVVSMETDAHTATIVIEDEGSAYSAQDIETLMAPFQRGENTATIDGHGLGLTIVATIAKLHGGSLSFEDTSNGLAARLLIQRS